MRHPAVASGARGRRTPESLRLWLSSFAHLAAGETAASVLRFLALVWVARRLGPASFGTVGAGMAVATYVAVFAHSGLQITATRDLAAAPHRAPLLLAETVTARLLLAALAYVGVLVVLAALPLEGDVGLAFSVFALSVFTLGADVRWSFVGIQRTKGVAVATAVSALAYFAGVVLLVRDAGDIVLVAGVQVGSEAVTTAILLVTSRRRFGVWRLGAPRSRLWSAWRQSLPITVMQGTRTVLMSVGVVLAAVLTTPVGAGQYAAAHRLVVVGVLYLGLYYNTFLPSLMRSSSGEQGEQGEVVRTALRRTWLLGPPAAAVGALAAPVAVPMALGPRYAGAVALVQVMVWGLVLLAFAGVYTSVLLAVHQQKRLAMVMAAALVVNVSVNGMLLPTVGAIGAAVAMVAAEATVLALSFLAAKPFLAAPAAGRARAAR